MQQNFEYVGFWARLLAMLVDSIILTLITLPILVMVYGDSYIGNDAFFVGSVDFAMNVIFPATATVLFWIYKQSTPGKMLLGARIVDAKTGEDISVKQSIIRYLAYIPSTVVFLLGFVWIAVDSRKQGWHDKIAGTVVVRKKYTTPDSV